MKDQLFHKFSHFVNSDEDANAEQSSLMQRMLMIQSPKELVGIRPKLGKSSVANQIEFEQLRD